MYDQLKSYIQSKVQLSDEDFEQIQSLSSTKKLRHHQYLLQEGEVCKFAAFVVSGCLRTYKVDDKGVEHIVYFAVENWWAGDRESFLSGEPSQFNIDAVENTEVVLFRKAEFEQLCRDIPPFNEMINMIIQRSFIAAQNRIHAAISLTAEEKYQKFLNEYAELANRVPQHMIASYLGMSPETLSRVRRTVFKKPR